MFQIHLSPNNKQFYFRLRRTKWLGRLGKRELQHQAILQGRYEILHQECTPADRFHLYADECLRCCDRGVGFLIISPLILKNIFRWLILVGAIFSVGCTTIPQGAPRKIDTAPVDARALNYPPISADSIIRATVKRVDYVSADADVVGGKDPFAGQILIKATPDESSDLKLYYYRIQFFRWGDHRRMEMYRGEDDLIINLDSSHYLPTLQVLNSHSSSKHLLAGRSKGNTFFKMIARPSA